MKGRGAGAGGVDGAGVGGAGLGGASGATAGTTGGGDKVGGGGGEANFPASTRTADLRKAQLGCTNKMGNTKVRTFAQVYARLRLNLRTLGR